MRKFIITLILISSLIPVTSQQSQASLISNRSYRLEQRRENKENIKQIKDLFKVHNKYANLHDIKNLKPLYADSYINNDGYNKEVYFKSIESTWEACNDLTYTTKIISIEVNGDYASVNVEETANGTILESLEFMPVSGEIHSKSRGIYHLKRINSKWYIAGETAISDESSLLYGDARFMNIEIQAPAQVSSGETYTTTLKVDTEPGMFILGSIDHDMMTYPASTPKTELRAITQSQTLERLIQANTNNLNEYTIASLAISKVKPIGDDNFKVYMAGLACIMKRVNVVPQNNYIKLEDNKEESHK